MAISLYDASVACFLQTVGAVEQFLQRGYEQLTKKGVDPNAFVETRLFPDMLPFRFQVISVAHHSLGAIEGGKKGLFGPPTMSDANYAELQKLIADTREGLEKLTSTEVNSLEGRDVMFQVGDLKLPFTAEGFLLSFSLPNLHFHATTAYDILRMNAVSLGKRHYLGAMRLKS